MKNKIEQLIALADLLDEEGKHEEAEAIDEMIATLYSQAEIKEWSPEEIEQRRNEYRAEQERNLQKALESGSVSREEADQMMGSEEWKAPFVSKYYWAGRDISPQDKATWKDLQQREMEEWRGGESVSKPPPPIKQPPKEPETKTFEDEEIIELEPNDVEPIEPEKSEESAPSDVDYAKMVEILSKDMSLFEEFAESPGFKDFVLNNMKGSLPQLKKHITELNAAGKAIEVDKENKKFVVVDYDGPKVAEQKSIGIQLFARLSDVADRLDKLGALEEANLVDGFIEKHADDVLEYQGEDSNSEQSKRYDSKYHHSLQVREPKTKQERVDREGRDSHHVHTYQTTSATSLSTRYCPDHIGVMVGRIGDNTYQCPKDGQMYNFETGWTDYDGNEHPGGSVAGQTPDSSGYATPHRIFDSRENILNRVN